MSTQDTWAAGEAYEQYMGRWSRLAAAKFVDWLETTPGRDWLDVGCGTGALTEVILARAEPAEVIGIDASAAFVGYAREHVPDARASFQVADSSDLPSFSKKFGAVVSGLALNFMSSPAAAIGEMAHVASAGGTVAAYVWDYGSQMQMLRFFWDAAVDLDEAAVDEDEGRRFPICKPGPLAATFESARLRQVKVGAIDVLTHFRDFDDYWLPFLGGQGPAPSYVASLDVERTTALRERVRSRLTVAADGSISLLARAWAVRGTR